MDRLLEHRNRALSPTDIFRIAQKTCNVLKYPDLKKFKNINDLFKKSSTLYHDLMPEYPFDKNTCIILYMSKPNFGHWCTINKYDDHYDFLDPYGTIIDDQLDFINPKFRKESDQDKAYLCKLLSKTKKPVHYNDYQLQELDGETATCGRYAALFLKYNEVPVEEFVEEFRSASRRFPSEEIDNIVTAMTTHFADYI